MGDLESFSVRRATLADLDALVSFALAEAQEAEQSRKSPTTVHQGVRTGLENPTIAQYWVLERDDGHLVGMVSVVKEWSDWHAGFYWWIQSIFIRPEYRGRDLIKALIDQVRDQAKVDGALQLRLYVHQDNLRAIKAYQKQNFSRTPYQIMQLDL